MHFFCVCAVEMWQSLSHEAPTREKCSIPVRCFEILFILHHFEELGVEFDIICGTEMVVENNGAAIVARHFDSKVGDGLGIRPSKSKLTVNVVSLRRCFLFVCCVVAEHINRDFGLGIMISPTIPGIRDDCVRCHGTPFAPQQDLFDFVIDGVYELKKGMAWWHIDGGYFLVGDFLHIA